MDVYDKHEVSIEPEDCEGTPTITLCCICGWEKKITGSYLLETVYAEGDEHLAEMEAVLLGEKEMINEPPC